MTAMDIGVAVLLTVLLFWGVIAGFGVLQAWGWGLDAAAMTAKFRDDPSDASVQWVLWMAATNVLPTLLHLCLACAGLWSGWLLRDAGFAAALQKLVPVAPATGLLTAGGLPLAASTAALPSLALSAPLTAAQAQKLVNWVCVDFWLATALPRGVVRALWPAGRWLLQWALKQLL